MRVQSAGRRGGEGYVDMGDAHEVFDAVLLLLLLLSRGGSSPSAEVGGRSARGAGSQHSDGGAGGAGRGATCGRTGIRDRGGGGGGRRG